MMMSLFRMAVIEITNLTKHFGSTTAVEDVSLAVELSKIL
jgi:ABC-type multidrug transport system ATPase subunit